MYVVCKTALGRGFVCPPQVLRGFRFKQSGESHYLSDALHVFTCVIPERLSISIPLSLSVRKKKKIPIATTNGPAP